MVFPGGGPISRHPSQLYEAFLEGLVLFVLLWSFHKKPWQSAPNTFWPHGSMLALFLIGYGVFRIVVEFAREPDPQIGILFGLASMGQILSSFMILGGMLIWIWRIRYR
jgi:phosphatidylglycerol:prolipoprotein diacylglycerol transferase